MIKVRKALKRFSRRIRSKKNRGILVFWLVAIGLVAAAIYSSNMAKRVDATAYTNLLSTIAEGESLGNYNAYFNNPNNSSLKLTEMTISDVLAWQENYVAAGNASSAVGRYQIIQPTLKGLVRELGIDQSQVFNEQTQDRMAIALIERRGSLDFINEKISAEQFAANLAKEWAALPAIHGDRPTESFYSGDGLNQSRISVGAILGAVGEFKSLAK